MAQPQQWVTAPDQEDERDEEEQYRRGRWGGGDISELACRYSKLGEFSVGGGGVGDWDLQRWGVFWSTPFINKHADCSKINTDRSCQCGADG